MMPRRGFLKGMVLSAAASTATALIKLTDEDAPLLVPKKEIVVAHAQWPKPKQAQLFVCMNRQFYPIGHVVSIMPRAPVDSYAMIDVTTMSEDTRRYVDTEVVITEQDDVTMLMKAFY